MSGTAHAPLRQALDISAQMLDAADRGHWSHVAELDAERQACIRQQHPADPYNIAALTTLNEHNRRLLERAARARAGVERQLGQHKYNHRALSTYIASSG
jgi:hypothetical protein